MSEKTIEEQIQKFKDYHVTSLFISMADTPYILENQMRCIIQVELLKDHYDGTDASYVMNLLKKSAKMIQNGEL